MAITEEKVFKCDKCGNEFKDNIYLEVDVNLDGVIANGCVNGDIYKHTCPNCKEHILFLNPITYRDSKKLYIIQSGDEETLKEAKKKFKDDIKYDGYKLYGARTNTEMIERIHELEFGYQPKFCELYKYYVGWAYEKKRLADPKLNYLNTAFIDIDVKGDLVIVLETIKNGGEADYITYPFDPLMYEKYLGQYFNQMKNIDDFVFDLFDVKKIVNFEE
jgi:hypothetical protein